MIFKLGENKRLIKFKRSVEFCAGGSIFRAQILLRANLMRGEKVSLLSIVTPSNITVQLIFTL